MQAGIKLTGELTLYDGLAPGAGIQVLYKSSGHSGFETGVFWQKRRYASFFTEGPGGGSLYQSKVFSHRLQIPFLYRFNSKPVNFSIGPVADFPIGKSINTDDPDPALKNFKNYKSTMILTVNFSHTFKLFRVFFLEPEIGFNYLPSRSDGGACINVSLRRTIF
ncbi:MAG TPA: hypothetical protein VF476_12095 [Chitinophagaceae bacterium]